MRILSLYNPTTNTVLTFIRPQRKAAEKSEAKAAKGAKSKAKGGPKRALSAYMFFSQDWRERIKSENPDAGFGERRRHRCPCGVDWVSPGEVGKLLGAKWKELEDDERKVGGRVQQVGSSH